MLVVPSILLLGSTGAAILHIHDVSHYLLINYSIWNWYTIFLCQGCTRSGYFRGRASAVDYSLLLPYSRDKHYMYRCVAGIIVYFDSLTVRRLRFRRAAHMACEPLSHGLWYP